MVTCSAPNCTNRTQKGVRLFRFPRDPKRRKIWALNCGREHWEPNDNSRLCEYHFDDSQFEQKRQDNWKKLKNTAVPTIFNISKRTSDNVDSRKSVAYVIEIVELPEEQMAKVLTMQDEIQLLEQDERIIENTTRLLEEEKKNLEKRAKLVQDRLNEMALRKISIQRRLTKLKTVYCDK